MMIDGKSVAALNRALKMLEAKAARNVTPPSGVQSAGSRAIELIKGGRAGGGFTGVGRARASQLANGSSLSEATVRRMHAYFSRHQGDRKPDWGKAGAETPGYVAWQAWGGDAGATWAASQVSKWNREDGKKEFPAYLPDGSDIKTVDQVAAMLNTTKSVAARYVIETKNVSQSLYEEAKAMTPGEDYSATGIMIAFEFDAKTSRQIAVAEGIRPNDLHVTLGYWGSTDKTKITQERLRLLCSKIAEMHRPFMVTLNGITRFAGDESTDPLVVNADAPQIEDIRKMVVEFDTEEGGGMYRNHGYTPHVTVGYIDPKDTMPITRWDKIEVPIKTVALHYGPDITRFPLGSRKTSPYLTVRREASA